jgi:hypothetical protein
MIGWRDCYVGSRTQEAIISDFLHRLAPKVRILAKDRPSVWENVLPGRAVSEVDVTLANITLV